MDVCMGTHVILRRTLALVFFLFLATGVILAQETNAGADVIVLSNGDHISGHLLKAGPESVVLENDVLGIVTIPSSNVSAVRHGNQPSLLQTKVEAKAIPELASHDAALLRGADYTLDNSDVGTSQRGKAPAAKAADPSVQLSLNAPVSFITGTQSQTVYGGAFRLIVRPQDLCQAPSWSTALLLAGNHSKTWVHADPLPAITMDAFNGTLSVTN